MNIEKILEEAPEGATNVDGDEVYWKLDGDDFKWLVEMPVRDTFEYQPSIIPDVPPVRSLDDLREITKLRAENEAYKQLVDFIIAGNSLDDKDRLSAYEQLLKMASQAAKE